MVDIGMFDYLKVCGLNVENVPDEVKNYLKNEVFQTKSLYCHSESYEIRKDGYLYRREEDEDGEFWVKIIKTFDLEFHTSVDEYWLSLIAKYKRGRLLDISLEKFMTIKDLQLENLESKL